MSKIVFCNEDITGIKYSGFTISKVYACGGELVYEYTRPTPEVALARYSTPSSGGWLEIGDDNSDSALTKNEVAKWVTNDEYNNMDALFFYSNCSSVGASAFTNCAMSRINSWGSITTIGDYAFKSCTNLSSVYICCLVETVGNYAFSGCTGLSSVILAASDIGDCAFLNCKNLISITLDKTVNIGDEVFEYCNITNPITIPNTISTIGEYAFSGNRNLTKIEFKGTTPPTIASTSFDDTNNCPIVIPTSVSKSAWSRGSGWLKYADRLKYPYEV